MLSTIILIVLAMALGGAVASFLGVWAERPLRGESILGRSHCACGRPLTASENIPVWGWLRVQGRTRCCQTQLPRRYIVSEVVLSIVYSPLLLLYVMVLTGDIPWLVFSSVAIALVIISIFVFFLLKRASGGRVISTPSVV